MKKKPIFGKKKLIFIKNERYMEISLEDNDQ
jgi:hypothetical protein